jgi:hypothetical protein
MLDPFAKLGGTSNERCPTIRRFMSLFCPVRLPGAQRSSLSPQSGFLGVDKRGAFPGSITASSPVHPAEETSMTKRYRLTARAEMFGAICDPGFEFTLPEGEIGPHRTVGAGLVDVPLYVEVTDAPLPEEKPEVVLSDEHAKVKAHIATIEAELADKDKQLGEAHAKLTAVDGALKA